MTALLLECKRGHRLDESNARFFVDKRYQVPARRCKTCHREHQREYRDKVKKQQYNLR